MASFDNGVNAPGGMSYAAPLMQFGNFANWAADDPYKKVFDQQQQQLNQQRLQQGQQQQDIAGTFKGGLPVDPATGAIDYKKAVQMLAQKGDVGAISTMAPQVSQQQAANTPLYPPDAGQPQGGPQPAPGPAVAPANSPKGDSPGSVISRVTDLLPPGSEDKIGMVAGNAAKYVGVDPNAPLTPEQAQKADIYLKRYAQANKIEPQSGTMPPSANAVSPAPPAAAPRPQPAQGGPVQPPQVQPAQPAPIGAPSPGQGQPAPVAPQRPQQPSPNGAGIPLPDNPFTGKPLTSPEAARNVVRALNQRMAELSANPANAQKVEIIKHQRDQIEAALKPVQLGQTLFGPDGKVLIQGTGAGGGQAGQLVRLENAERVVRGEPPMTAKEEISFIQGIHPPRSAPAMAVEAFKKDFEAKNGRLPTGDEITKFAANYSGEQSYGRTAGSTGARVENATNEVEQLIPQAVEASKNYERQGGKYVGLNKLFQSFDQGTSDPKYNDFVLANFSLINAYTRAMNPQGVPRIAERLEQHAAGILSTATSEKAYEVQVRRLWKEVQASKTATAKTAEGRTPGDINSPVPGLDAAAPAAPVASPAPGGGVKWGRAPDGSPSPVQ